MALYKRASAADHNPKFKRGDGVGVSYNYTKPSEAEAARLKEESGSGLSPQEKFPRTFDKPSFQTDQPKDGVINE